MAEGEFSFTLTPSKVTSEAISNGALSLKDQAETLVCKNSQSGMINFGENAITFKQAGTYSFNISEVKGDDPNITYSDHVATVEAKVTDQDGNLTVEWIGLDTVKFENTYQPFSTSIQFTGNKQFSGRDMNEGEFNFVVLDVNGKEVAHGKNKQDGIITFTEINYDQVGTYNYDICEVNDALGGIQYDTKVVHATVSVVDDDGQLKATVVYDNETIFNNTYRAKPTSISFEALKQMVGRPLKNQEFTFVLKDQDGHIIQEQQNDENGRIIFDAISYDQAGQYVYTVEEVKGSDATITYDGNIYTIVVDVVDDLKGNLNPKITVTNTGEHEAALLFTNTYSKPIPTPDTKPDQTPGMTPDSNPDETPVQSPETSDTTHFIHLQVLMIVSGLGVVYTMNRKRKQSHI